MGSPDCGRRRTEHVCGQRGGEGVQWVRGAERRLVPCEVTYPARSSTPARMSAAGPRVAPCPCPSAGTTRHVAPHRERTRAVSITLATLPHPGRTLFVSRLVGWACKLRASGGYMCMDARSGPGDVTSQGTKPPLRAHDPLHTVWCTPPTHVLCWRRPQSGAINHWAARRKASSVHARVPSARPQPERYSNLPADAESPPIKLSLPAR